MSSWTGIKIVVTGANRGIGLGMCKVLSAAGAEIYAATRTSSTALDGIDLHGGKIITGIDMKDDACGEVLKTARLGRARRVCPARRNSPFPGTP